MIPKICAYFFIASTLHITKLSIEGFLVFVSVQSQVSRHATAQLDDQLQIFFPASFELITHRRYS